MSVPDDPSPAFYWEETRRPDRHVRSRSAGGVRADGRGLDSCPCSSRRRRARDSREPSRAIPSATTPAGSSAPSIKKFSATRAPPGPGLCLLLTGTFFKHHFSAVVSLGIDPDRPDGLVLDVDVADRCRAPVDSLAATYTVRLDSGALADAGPQAIIWDNVGRRASAGSSSRPSPPARLSWPRPGEPPRACRSWPPSSPAASLIGCTIAGAGRATPD